VPGEKLEHLFVAARDSTVILQGAKADQDEEGSQTHQDEVGADQPEVRGQARCRLPYPLRQ
jgi:hypothetical protein